MIWLLLSLFCDALYAGGGARPGVREGSPPLSWVVKEHASGWTLEDEATRAVLETAAKKYIELRAGKLDEEEREKIVSSCESTATENENPFCPALQKQPSRKKAAEERTERRKRKARIASYKTAFRQKNWKLLAAANESELVAAIRLNDNQKTLTEWSRAALEHPECAGSTLPLALGLKMEKFFPDAEAREISRGLYEKAGRCGSDSAAVQAFYRLGLLAIWDGKYPEAEIFLSQVVDNPLAQDFRQRALYWRYTAAVELKERGRQKEMRERLLKEYPLSLHGLLISTDNLFGDLPMLNSKEPQVSFRTRGDPAINAQVLAAEALQSLGAFDASFDVLDPLSERLAGTEVSFQLYVAILLMRSGDSMKKFGLLASLFKENPYLISQPTLELLYPLRRFDIIQSHTATSSVDPYLILSLIRQESAFNDRARSVAGALGLMQLLPVTARRFERVSRAQLYDPKVNVRVGTKFFEKLIARFEGDVELALAAYNAGPERVDEWRKRYPIQNRLLFLDLMPFRETRDYVASIARNYYWYLRLYSQENLRNRIHAQESSRAVLKIFGMAGADHGS